jgi:hypothetical protein
MVTSIPIKLREKYRLAFVDGGGKPKRLKGGATNKQDNGVAKRRSIWWYLHRSAQARMKRG